MADPKLAARGVAMTSRLRRRGIRVAYQTSLVGVERMDGRLLATFRSQDGTETRHEVDAVCMNDGFEPQNEILRLLGAEMRYDPDFGHLRCRRSDRMETTGAPAATNSPGR